MGRINYREVEEGAAHENQEESAFSDDKLLLTVN